MHSYFKEKLCHYIGVLLSLSIILLALLYRFVSPLYGLYRWQQGVVITLFVAVVSGFVFTHWKLYLYYVQGYKCPDCGGLVEMDEIEVLGSVKTDDGSVPQVIDRISICTLCEKENHLVYVHSVFYNLDMNSDQYTQSIEKRLQRRPESALGRVLGLIKGKQILPTKKYRFSGPFEMFFTHSLEAKAVLRKIGLSEAEMEQIMTSERTLSDMIGEYLPSYEDWYLLVRDLQKSADRHNQTSGICLDWPESMHYIPEGFSPEWLIYGKYEWKNEKYQKASYRNRKDIRNELEKKADSRIPR